MLIPTVLVKEELKFHGKCGSTSSLFGSGWILPEVLSFSKLLFQILSLSMMSDTETVNYQH